MENDKSGTQLAPLLLQSAAVMCSLQDSHHQYPREAFFSNIPNTPSQVLYTFLAGLQKRPHMLCHRRSLIPLSTAPWCYYLCDLVWKRLYSNIFLFHCIRVLEWQCVRLFEKARVKVCVWERERGVCVGWGKMKKKSCFKNLMPKSY